MKFFRDARQQMQMANTGGDTMFQSGRLECFLRDLMTVIKYYDADNVDDYGWVMLPYADVNVDGQCQKEERVSIYNGLGWAAYANTDDPDAAYSLISHFCSEEKPEKTGRTWSYPGRTYRLFRSLPGGIFQHGYDTVY